MRIRRIGVVLASLALAGGLAPAVAEAAPGWDVSYLPTSSVPYTFTYVTGTDNKGEYSGYSTVLGSAGKVVSWRNGQLVERGAPEGRPSLTTTDENGSGTIIGAASGDGLASRAFTLKGSAFRILGAPEGFDTTYPRAINAAGDIAGYAYRSGEPYAPLLWKAADPDHPVLLPLPIGSFPIDLDDDGTILFAVDNGGPQLWKDGVVRTLATPAGYQNPGGWQLHNGQVVGSANQGDYTTASGFLWPTPDKPVKIPNSKGAQSFNKAGLVAGTVPDPNSIARGLPAAWNGTVPAGKLPLPDNFSRGSVILAADDGVILGQVYGGGQIQEGIPVIWRHHT